MDLNGDFGSGGHIASSPIDDFIDNLIFASRIDPKDRITIAGHKTLQILLGLCRRGFVHVAARTGAEGPHVGEGVADSLWLLDAENAAELRTLVVRFGRDLRINGTLLVGLGSGAPVAWLQTLNCVLAKCGFVPVRRFQTANRAFLICARKQPQPILNLQAA